MGQQHILQVFSGILRLLQISRCDGIRFHPQLVLLFVEETSFFIININLFNCSSHNLRSVLLHFDVDYILITLSYAQNS